MDDSLELFQLLLAERLAAVGDHPVELLLQPALLVRVLRQMIEHYTYCDAGRLECDITVRCASHMKKITK